jgi:hypothetical protein
MRRVRASIAAALAGGVLTTACAGQPILYNEFVHSGYSPTEYGVGAGRKDLRMVVYGDPFGLGEAEFAAATVAILNRHQPFLQPTHFTTTPDESASARHRMVLIFDQPRIPVFRLCRTPITTPPARPAEPAPARTLHVSAAFCLHGGELTAVQGKIDGVEGVDDPKLDRLLGQIVLALFPPIDPNDDDHEPWLMADLAQPLIRRAPRGAAS